MKKLLLVIFAGIIAAPLFAQKVDSIYFNLYTDSLKKGQHNYINIDGKMSNGRWMPMTAKEIDFSCSQAVFQGNELIIPADFKPEKVTIRAVLKSNPAISREVTVWIKQKPDGPLPTQEEVMRGMEKRKRN